MSNLTVLPAKVNLENTTSPAGQTTTAAPKATTTTTTTPNATTTTQPTANTTQSSNSTTTLQTELSTEAIISISVVVPIVVILLTVVLAIILCRRRKILREKGQRLPNKSPDQQIKQTGTSRPALDVPLTTYEVANPDVASPTYYNYTDLNQGTVPEEASRIRADSQSQLYENPEPQSIVPRSESKQILVPKGWNPKSLKPTSPRHKPTSPALKPSPPKPLLPTLKSASPRHKPFTPKLQPKGQPTPKGQRNPQAPKTSPRPNNPQRQQSAESPYYITVQPEPSPSTPSSYFAFDAKNQGQTDHYYKNVSSATSPKSKGKKQKRKQKELSPAKKETPDRQDSIISNNYYNLNDDKSYQNVELKLTK